jgi:dCMP deaminase
MTKIILAFIPVLHEGYRRLLETHADADCLYVFGDSFSEEFPYLKKEIRALPVDIILKSVRAWGMMRQVKMVEISLLEELASSCSLIIMPDDDVCRGIAEKYLKGSQVQFSQIFLRWDKHNASIGTKIVADQTISLLQLDQQMMALAEARAKRSSDWWRQVGAVLCVKGEPCLIDHNQHVPSEHMPYAEGDPRNCFSKGVHLDLSTAIHAEAKIIAEAARRGLSLQGSSLYVTTFPCPPCAKLIAYSGISKLYYGGGYGVLDGERILQSKEVEIIFVDQKNSPSSA